MIQCGIGEAGIKLHRGPLPPIIVVDETWVKVGGKEAWIYVALDPRTLKVVYLEPFFVRDEGNTNAFLVTFFGVTFFGVYHRILW